MNRLYQNAVDLFSCFESIVLAASFHSAGPSKPERSGKNV